MTRIIIIGAWLIVVSLTPKRKYILLSGHYEGRTWVKRL